MSTNLPFEKPDNLSVKRFDRAHKTIFESVKAKKVVSAGTLVTIGDLLDFNKWEFVFTKTQFLTVNEITQNYPEGIKQRRMSWPEGVFVRYLNQGNTITFIDREGEFVDISTRDLNSNDWEVIL